MLVPLQNFCVYQCSLPTSHLCHPVSGHATHISLAQVQISLWTIINITGEVKIGVAFVSGSHCNQPHLGSTSVASSTRQHDKWSETNHGLPHPFLPQFTISSTTFHPFVQFASTFTASLVYLVDILCTLTFLLFSLEWQTAFSSAVLSVISKYQRLYCCWLCNLCWHSFFQHYLTNSPWYLVCYIMSRHPTFHLIHALQDKQWSFNSDPWHYTMVELGELMWWSTSNE